MSVFYFEEGELARYDMLRFAVDAEEADLMERYGYWPGKRVALFVFDGVMSDQVFIARAAAGLVSAMRNGTPCTFETPLPCTLRTVEYEPIRSEPNAA